MAEEGKDPTGEAGAGTPRRKPYEKPAIQWEEALGDRPNLMASCGQRPAEGDDCTAAPFS
jgi:hypothetical protein